MALTRPRASQIYDIDYKQATRVVTVTNISLVGSAPNQVDGVNLSVNDRILVTGQSDKIQNGIYYVSTLGSGSDGTWTRSLDTNATGELLAGTIVMVTSGLEYADTQWKLITDDPIVIGVTQLTFTQNYLANSISSGTSNVSVNSNANVTISSAGTANVLTVSNGGIFVTGQVSATGNITGSYFIGNGSQLTGLPASYGNANVADYLPTYTGNLTAGNISATGNITGNYFVGNGSQLTNLPAGSSLINGNSNVVVANDGNVTVTIAGAGPVGKFSPGELTVYGVYSNPNTIDDNVVIESNTNSMMVGPVSVNPANNVFVPDGSALKIL